MPAPITKPSPSDGLRDSRRAHRGSNHESGPRHHHSQTTRFAAPITKPSLGTTIADQRFARCALVAAWRIESRIHSRTRALGMSSWGAPGARRSASLCIAKRMVGGKAGAGEGHVGWRGGHQGCADMGGPRLGLRWRRRTSPRSCWAPDRPGRSPRDPRGSGPIFR